MSYSKVYTSYHSYLSNDEIPRTIDMHVHTIRSIDGGLSVNKVLNHSLTNNVSHLAIADHNNIDGVKIAQRIIANDPQKFKDLTLIPGVEISCCDYELGARFHLLVYDFDLNNEKLNKLLKDIQKSEKENYYALFAFLEKNFNITFSPYEIKKAAATHEDVTLDVIAEMAVLHLDENGKPAPYAKTKDEFLEYVKRAWSANKHSNKNKNRLMIDVDMNTIELSKLPSLEDVLPIIKEAGGIPVLAHPKHIKFLDENGKRIKQEDIIIREDGLDAESDEENKETHDDRVKHFIKQFREKADKFNLDAGMEVFFAAAAFGSQYYLDLAKEFNLIPSGGSDFHGAHKSMHHRIGTVSNRFYITQLPIIDYLTNGRVRSNISIPDYSNECFKNIEPYVRKKYASKNESIKAKIELKKATNMQAVLTQFGEEPMPVYHFYSRMLDIKRRNVLLAKERDIFMLLNTDKSVLKNSQKNKDACKSNIGRLEKNFHSFHFLLKEYEEEIEKFKMHDRAENKEKFMHYLNTKFINFKQQIRDHISTRKEMYNKFNIDIVKMSNKLKQARKKQFTQNKQIIQKQETAENN